LEAVAPGRIDMHVFRQRLETLQFLFETCEVLLVVFDEDEPNFAVAQQSLPRTVVQKRIECD